MSSKFKIRIICTLIVGIVIFILFSINFKLLEHKEDWLYYSIVWSITHLISYNISDAIIDAMLKDGMNGMKKKDILKIALIFDAIILFFVVLLMTFILGVIISLSNWYYIVFDTCFPFALSLLVFTVSKYYI